MFRVN